MKMTSNPLNAPSREETNAEAWKNCGGYQTTSGCPCYDKTMSHCIPKSFGYGFNPNFYVWFCCFLCDKKKDGEEQTN
jgi:hypothetical protein